MIEVHAKQAKTIRAHVTIAIREILIRENPHFTKCEFKTH